VLLDVDVDSEDWNQIVAGAQRIWMETWGPVRSSGKSQRCNFVSPRKLDGSETFTETSWRRKRRHDIDTALEDLPHKSRSKILLDATVASVPSWNPSMGSKENSLLQSQAEDRACAFLDSEPLLPHEIAPHTITDAAAASVKRCDADRQQDRKKQKKLAILHRPDFADLQGLTVHIQAAGMPVDLQASCEAHIQNQGGVLIGADSVPQAVIFVVQSMRCIDMGVRVAAGMLGGEIICPRSLLSKGADGNRVSYNPSARIKRRIFISDNFVGHHLDMSSNVVACVNAPSSQWRWCASLDEFRRFRLLAS